MCLDIKISSLYKTIIRNANSLHIISICLKVNIVQSSATKMFCKSLSQVTFKKNPFHIFFSKKKKGGKKMGTKFMTDFRN